MKNKRCLVTGGAGSIGSELVRQLSKNNKVFVLDQNETALFDVLETAKEEGRWVYGRVGDIRDRDVLFDVFSDFKPQVVFQCAALKHVPLNEKYPEEAVSTNVVGNMNVVHEAERWDCLEKFVYISTDKVTHSTSVMGATKRCGEVIVRSRGKKFVVVRFGNVLGSRGSVVPIWERQIREGKPVTVTHPAMTRYFMTISEACALVVEAGEKGKNGELWVMDMGKPVSILGLAKEIIERSRADVSIEITGLRPGEMLSERLMFEEEEKVATKENNFYIIR